MEAAAERVRRRTNEACEYCRIPQSSDALPFHVDHIIARQHGGSDSADNLAAACYNCNLHKGPNIAGIDPKTRRLTRLFNPRKDRWSAHFFWNGAELRGRTAVGRTTIVVLAINLPIRISHRDSLLAEGVEF